MGTPFILNTPGEIEINDIFVKGIDTYHDNDEGAKHGKNTIFVIDSENIQLAYLGDFGEKKIKDDLLEKLGNVDILLMSIVAKYRTQPIEEAINIIKQIQPKIIIPMHYSKKEDLEKFIKEIGTSPERLEKLNIKRNNISDDEDAQMQLIVLENN